MNQSYRDKVFYKFQSMGEGEVFDLHIHVSPENFGAFIATSKQLIDEDLMPDHYMEFSDDYSQIKKKAKITPIQPTRNTNIQIHHEAKKRSQNACK